MKNAISRTSTLSLGAMLMTLSFAMLLLDTFPSHSEAPKPTPSKKQPEPSSNPKGPGFFSEKAWIPVERFEPKKSGEHPAILLLPESKSLKVVAPVYRDIAQRFANQGYIVLMIDFLARTGDQWKGAPKLEEIGREAYTGKYLAWVDTVRDAIPFALKQKGVKGSKVGLMGFSLGGFLSLSVSVRHNNLPVAAVAEFFGGLPDELWLDLQKLSSLPPTLLVHGKRDQRVCVKEAYALDAIFKEKKWDHELKIYDTTHLFQEELAKLVKAKNGKLGMRDLFKLKNVLSAYLATSTFFQKYLQSPRQD